MKKKDLFLLFLLAKNFRIAKSKLSKDLQISQETINKRISNFEETGLIKGYKICINYFKLGFREYDLYLRIRKYTKNEFEKIISFFENSEYVTWIGNSFGKYDFRLSLIVLNSNSLFNFIEDFKISFPKLIDEYLVLEVLKKHKIDINMIFSNLLNFNFEENSSSKKISELDLESYILDKNEKILVKNLSENPKQNIVELANSVKLTPEAISYKLKSLNKKGIITQYSVVIDGNKLNKIWAVFLFRLNSKNKEQFKSFIVNQKNVSAFVEVLGSWDYSVSVFANSVQEIQSNLIDFRNNFPNELIDYEMIILFKTYKYPKIPEIIFK